MKPKNFDTLKKQFEAERQIHLIRLKEYALNKLNLSEKEFEGLKKSYTHSDGTVQWFSFLSGIDSKRQEKGIPLTEDFVKTEYILLEHLITNNRLLQNRHLSRAETARIDLSREKCFDLYVQNRLKNRDFIYQALSSLPSIEEEMKKYNRLCFMSNALFSFSKGAKIFKKAERKVIETTVGGFVALAALGVCLAPLYLTKHQDKTANSIQQKMHQQQR